MLSSRFLELHKSPNLSTDGMIIKDAEGEDKVYMNASITLHEYIRELPTC